MLIRTRIAPSPTGFMHIGTLRTALTNYLFSKKRKGRFIIRLEDTDRTRLVPESEQDIIRSLKWARLTWDEGIDFNQEQKIIEKGSHGPYVQSKRLKIYNKYARELLKKDHAYYCFCTKKCLEKMKNEQQKLKQPPRYDKRCANLPQSVIREKLKSKQSFTIRLKIPAQGTTRWQDLVRGPISIENKLIDDQVLMKSDGFPTYHFAVVIDDHLMAITHVLRGEEWLSSTPKHLLLYQAFGWRPPKFGHLPQLLNVNGKKLSKRDGDVAVRDFIKKGYLPHALINFIALLGWNPKTTQEIFSLKELIKQFDLKKINKAGAKFDYNRLNWFNARYIKSLKTKELLKLSQPFIKNLKLPAKKIEKILFIQKERLSRLKDITKDIPFLIEKQISYPKELLAWKNQSNEQIQENLQKARIIISSIDIKNFSLDNIQNKLLKAGGEKRGELLWPLRVALSGQKQSPSPFECAWVLGKKQTLKRIEQAIISLK
ncbi:MAG: glutamate--tRNA ligase [Patescibacteria group bacterium]|nr:glutamate--tRNA ligase [Patescibacteria group bacterium]